MSKIDTPQVVVSPEPMSLTELVAVARGARVHLSEDALALINAARAVVEDALQSDQPHQHTRRALTDRLAVVND